MDRRTALTVLGLDDDTDLPALKRRFRELARTRHPDRGGDEADFQRLHAAYEALRAGLSTASAPATPSVARGRPSRTGSVAETARTLDDEPLGAAAAALAQRIVAGGACLSSRAPGAWSNRLAHALSAATTSTLEATIDAEVTQARRSTGDDHGRAAAAHRVRITLTGRSRTARRALTTLDLAAPLGTAWARHRGDAVTVVETQVVGPDAATAAHRAAVTTTRLLSALGWPLEQWQHG